MLWPGPEEKSHDPDGHRRLIRELLFKTRRYREDQLAGKQPAFDMKLEAMIPVVEGKLPLKAHAHRADDILTAIRIAKEFNLQLTLDHCTDGEVIADELALEGYPAFVGPSFGGKTKIELRSKSFTTPGRLHQAGVPISIITDAPVIPLQYLPMCAGLAAHAGLNMDEAWRAITINPARQTGIGHRVGSLEPAKTGMWSSGRRIPSPLPAEKPTSPSWTGKSSTMPAGKFPGGKRLPGLWGKFLLDFQQTNPAFSGILWANRWRSRKFRQ